MGNRIGVSLRNAEKQEQLEDVVLFKAAEAFAQESLLQPRAMSAVRMSMPSR